MRDPVPPAYRSPPRLPRPRVGDASRRTYRAIMAGPSLRF